MKEFLTTNMELKIASLIIAVGLWFFVMLSGRGEVTMDIPVKFINVPSSYEIMDYPGVISVSIEGQERLLKYLKPNEVSAVINLANAKEGRSFHTIQRENIELPKSFLVTSINPETISMNIERQLKKIVAVKPRITGTPLKGFRITDIKVEPDIVTLKGPESIVSRIKRVRTEDIDIDGINSSIIYKATIKLKNTHVKKNINKVDVKLTIESITRKKPENGKKENRS